MNSNYSIYYLYLMLFNVEDSDMKKRSLIGLLFVMVSGANAATGPSVNNQRLDVSVTSTPVLNVSFEPNQNLYAGTNYGISVAADAGILTFNTSGLTDITIVSGRKAVDRQGGNNFAFFHNASGNYRLRSSLVTTSNNVSLSDIGLQGVKIAPINGSPLLPDSFAFRVKVNTNNGGPNLPAGEYTSIINVTSNAL
ncbi:hypothetical protein PY718_26180 (plasmid) [Escherichia coli]|uniref:hypothetical protein n=1 Tax=Escherichia coli TaxID=562 RepID=UPI0021F4ED40|nr:hypothetical protein [Escherichia coli]MCV8867509.1 hypothetical protein [Escherichia coli]WKB88056.1 hypothetical protein PY718_26180 [Escherichia coli]